MRIQRLDVVSTESSVLHHLGHRYLLLADARRVLLDVGKRIFREEEPRDFEARIDLRVLLGEASAAADAVTKLEAEIAALESTPPPPFFGYCPVLLIPGEVRWS